jgi:hypothetical protein
MLTLKVKAVDCIPPGAYRARFETFEPYKNDKFGDGLRFIFTVLKPVDYAGKKASRITSATPTLKNAGGKIIAGLTGRELHPDEEFDLAPFVGKEYLINVAKCANGEGTRIESLIQAEVS